jgi:hypothetical protein
LAEQCGGARDHQIAHEMRELVERQEPVALADAPAVGDQFTEEHRRRPRQHRLRVDDQSGEAMRIDEWRRLAHGRECKRAGDRSD